jgi:hypothetical protein
MVVRTGRTRDASAETAKNGCRIVVSAAAVGFRQPLERHPQLRDCNSAHMVQNQRGKTSQSTRQGRLTSARFRAFELASFLRQPRLAQAFEHMRQIRRMRDHPFDGEFGKDTSGFRQCGLRVVHLAFERVGGREI